MHLKEIGWEDIKWIHLAQDKDQWEANLKMVMNLHVPWSIQYMEGHENCASWS
jgi:hypothetical protein